jgi:putative spermidine/putrescine transport system substrate-binding protein
MLNRRSLLIGAGTLALAQLAGCRARSQVALRIQLLAGSIPAQLLGVFQRQLEQQPKLNFASANQLSELYDLLQKWQPPQTTQPRVSLPFTQAKPIAVADLITLGDSWLTAAIQQKLVQPLSVEQLAGWQQLPSAWQELVRRDRQGVLSDQGEIWAAPYRWGTLVIAYRPEQFKRLGWVPQDWSDLWRSELQGKISLLESPRSAIGLTLKKLGKSFNLETLDAAPNLKAELQALHQQVKFYSSDNYLQPLLLGDTWAAVGWSTDVLPAMKNEPRIAAVVPASGTLLSADLWVRPATTGAAQPLNPLATQWIDFFWRSEVASQLSVLSSAVSPMLFDRTAQERVKLPKALQDSLRLPPIEVLQRSEFLLSLPAAMVEQYHRLWVEVRQGS